MSDECPTPVHHPLTVCQVCHPDEWARRQESARAFSEAIAQTYDNLTSIDWPTRFGIASDAARRAGVGALAAHLAEAAEYLRLPGRAEAIGRALLGREAQ